ncbi:MAG: DUF4388 domain-containing protein [Deltaproteobacteria bacterium]|nr:DUF4388 domain-containing protein [Deltaproteobacteria bacterium]
MGVKGRIKDMGLIDIIQIFNAERKTVAIHLGSDMGYGRVYMEEGRIVHATHRDSTGADALYQLLAWKDGEFEVEPDVRATVCTISESPEGLILEGLRRLDESTRGIGQEHGRYVGDMESVRLINRLIELKIIEKA